MQRSPWVWAAALVAAIGFGPAAVDAGDDPPADVKAVFESLCSQWKGGSADGLAQYFGDNVSLALDDQVNGNYSKKQAKQQLREYFQRTAVEKVEHNKYVAVGGGWSEECKYEYRPAGGGLQKKKISFQIRNESGRWILQSVSVY